MMEKEKVESIKIGLLGASESGKTAYLVMLNNSLISKKLIRSIEPDGVISSWLNQFKITMFPLSGFYTLKRLHKALNDWIKGVPPPVTISLFQEKFSALLPIYKKSKKLEELDIFIYDTPGAITHIFNETLNDLKLSPNEKPKKVMKAFYEKLQGLKKYREGATRILEKLVMEENYDVLFIVIDPDESNVAEVDKLLFSELFFLLPFQKNKNLTVTVLFSKSIYRGLIPKDVLTNMTLDTYLQYSFSTAVAYLSGNYPETYKLLWDWACKKKKIRFGGAFCYDAFVEATEDGTAPKLIVDESKNQYFHTFGLLFPFLNSIHISKKKKAPLSHDAIKKVMCGK